MSNEQEEIRYSRDRSRSRDRGSEDEYDRDGRGSRNFGNEEGHSSSENFALYVSNMSIETTDETLRSQFERFGEVQSASIVREPITKKSRGFAFVNMAKADDSIRALTEMNGAEIEGHTIRVEKAKRKEGYEKTPGQYLGPPQLSSKYRRGDRDREDRDRRGRAGGDSRDRSRRDDHRRDSRDRFRDPRDVYDRYPPYQLPPPHLYDRAPLLREDRYLQELRAELYRRDFRYDPRDIRAPPLLAQPLYDLRRSPPRGDYRPRSPLSDRRPSERGRRSSSRH